MARRTTYRTGQPRPQGHVAAKCTLNSTSFCTARVAPEKAVFRPALPLHSWPEFTGEHMATMTYREQLLHPNWQRKRLEIMQRDEFRCQCCMATENTLHVHHKQYAKGRLAWEYPNDELVTLCETCHDTMHEQMGMLRDVTAKLPVDGPGCIGHAIAVLGGWANGAQGMRFYHLIQEEPGSYVSGEIAQLVHRHLSLEELMQLQYTLEVTPEWLVREAFNALVKSCEARKDEPAPPGYEQPEI